MITSRLSAVDIKTLLVHYPLMRTAMIRGFSVLVYFGLCCLEGNAQHSGHTTDLPIVIDGSRTPDQIPDQLAYHHFFLAVAEHDRPSPEESARQNSRLVPLRLSDTDTASFVRELSRFREQLDDIERSREQTASSPSLTLSEKTAAFEALKARQQTLVATTLANIRGFLSPAGLERLDRHVKEHVKPRIAIFGTR